MITSIKTARIQLKNILFLTDFSEPSESALPFAAVLARAFNAKVHALHVLLPEPAVYIMPEMTAEAVEVETENAWAEMKRVESQLDGVSHHSYVVRDANVWKAVNHVAAEIHADLIVLGTHGRTGAEKMLFGSVAEEIFRRSHIPVMTIGPRVAPPHNGAHFKSVLFATDFSPASLAAAPHAISLAEENQSRLILLNVIPGRDLEANHPAMTDALRWLQELIPPEAEFWCRPETIVKNGDIPVRILENARARGTDLIVLGVHSPDRLGATTHIGGSVAHEVVAHAPCPVLTVRQ